MLKTSSRKCLKQFIKLGRDSSVCITTRYGLDGRSGDRIPVGGEIFGTRRAGPGVHPTPHTIGTRSLSLGVKRPGRDFNHPPPPIVEVKKRVEL
jgi:hypothetical protein